MSLVSVIMPTYGYPQYLSQAIDSVLNQTFYDLELIVVDDNNPNTQNRIDTQNIINEQITRDRRVKYIQHPYNKNGSAARNTGLKAAKGKYIAFLDSDDIYMPERIEKCCNALESSSPKYSGVYTGCEFRQRGIHKSYFKKVESGNFLIQTLACNFMFCTGSNIFMKREVFSQLSGFDETFTRHQDYEFLVRYFQNYSLIGLNEVLVIKNNDNVNRPDVLKMIQIKRQYLSKYQSIIDSLPVNEKNYVLHSNYIAIAEQASMQGEKEISKEYYKKAKDCGRFTFSEQLRKLVIPYYAKMKK